MTEISEIAQVAEVDDISEIAPEHTENIDDVGEFNEEMNSMRKLRRLAIVLAETKDLPNAGPTTYVPPFRTKNELHTLDTLCAHPDLKDKSHYAYQCEQDPKAHQWRSNTDRRRSTDNTPVKMVWVEKLGKATDMAQQSLKDGSYMVTVDTVTDQLNNRELLLREKFMVVGMARMKMITVKRKQEANNLREALQEWIEDARILVQLNDEDAAFSIVSMIDEEETKEEVKKEEKEKKEVKKENKKKSKKNKNKETTENKETKKDDEKEGATELEAISISFSTRFYGVEYSITVEMPNDEDVRVKTLPVLRGIDKKITDILAVSTLLDAVTFEFWKSLEK